MSTSQITAMIYGKDRKPDKVMTVESLLADNLNEVAAEMKQAGIVATYCYLVGKHGYQKDLYADGRQSVTHKIW